MMQREDSEIFSSSAGFFRNNPIPSVFNYTKTLKPMG
jgi:hypothetical protein